MASEPDGLREFVTDVSPALLRSAYLLTGDLASAEDLVQGALVKTWRHWAKVQAAGQPEAYVRRILVNEYLGSKRRRWSGEMTVQVPEHEAVDPGFAGVEDRAKNAVSFRYRNGEQKNGVPIEDAITEVLEAISSRAQV